MSRKNWVKDMRKLKEARAVDFEVPYQFWGELLIGTSNPNPHES
jgi:hypothetical protein